MNVSSDTPDLDNARIKNSPYAGWFGTVRHYFGYEKLGDGSILDDRLNMSFGGSVESGADFLLPGGARHYLALLDSGEDTEMKILRCGVTDWHHISFGVGSCAYPSLEAAGLAIRIGVEVSMTTGKALIPVEHFTVDLGLPVRKLKRLNRHLVASGVWNIVEDEDAGMVTYELTTFGLAQIAASRDLVNAYQTEDQPIGPYINVVMRVPDIEVRMQELMSFLDSLQSTATA